MNPTAFFANATITARESQGFMTFRRGWMAFADGFGLLLESAAADGLFPTRVEALREGKAFQARMQSELSGEVAG